MSRSESGQASVEAIAVVPMVVLAAAIAWQLVLVGHTLWLCANAARVAARADLVGLTPERAARSALPKSLERGLSVERADGGGVRVELRLPILLRAWESPVRVAAVASLGGRAMRGERGQATLELLGLLPVLLAVALAGAQLLAVGYSSVLAGNAAEAGALALAGGADPRAGARAALPGWSRAHARVSVSGGQVRVRMRPPSLLRSLAERLEVAASAAVEAH